MFDNFISLGPRCATADSMSKYGLRNWSGPFDWLVTTSFEKVLYLIENGFEGFMLKENLEIDSDKKHNFYDTKNEILFTHDEEFAISLEENYDELIKKYKKKIKRFLQELDKKNCFLRIVNDNAELKYIVTHEEDINRILKKNNIGSEIIFLISKEVKIPENMNFRYYIVQPPISNWRRDRKWFDYSDDFLEYCKSNFDDNTLLKNIAFDSKKEDARIDAVGARYQLLLRLINYDFSKLSVNKDLIVYGAGNNGRYFYQQIKNKYVVKYFVDLKVAGGDIDNIPIVWLNDIEDEHVESACFIVTATYDYENIFKTIKRYFPNAQIMSLEELLI